MTVTIAREGREGLAEFVALLETLGAWLWARGIEQWEAGSNRAQQPRFERFLDEGTLLAARRDGSLVGGCLLTRLPYPEWDERPGDAAYLHKLVVDRSVAATGLGTRLLDAAADWARGQDLPALRLDCWDGNDALRAYYRARGFVELEAVPSHGYRVRLFERPASGAQT